MNGLFSTPEWNRYLFFYGIFPEEEPETAECVSAGRNDKWRNRTGKARNILISAIRNVNFFHVIRVLTLIILTACSVTVRCMRWETDAAVISDSQRMESKTVLIASFHIRERAMDI